MLEVCLCVRIVHNYIIVLNAYASVIMVPVVLVPVATASVVMAPVAMASVVMAPAGGTIWWFCAHVCAVSRCPAIVPRL